MTGKELITDNVISIVFENTNFGGTPHRKVVETALLNINEGYSIGHTAKCCLVELGLITELSYRNIEVTRIGNKYLEILKQ